jgi:hypothetical protein
MKKKSIASLCLLSFFTAFSAVSCGSTQNSVPSIKVIEPSDRQIATITFYNLSYFDSCNTEIVKSSSGRFTLGYEIKQTNIPVEINDENKSHFKGWTTSKESKDIINTVTIKHYKPGSTTIVDLFPLVSSNFTIRLLLPNGKSIDIKASGYLGRELYDGSTRVNEEDNLTLDYLNNILQTSNINYSLEGLYGQADFDSESNLVPCSFIEGKYNTKADLIVYGKVTENTQFTSRLLSR